MSTTITVHQPFPYLVLKVERNRSEIWYMQAAEARQLAHDLLAAVGAPVPVVGGILGGHGWSVDRSGPPLVLDSEGRGIAQADSHTAAWRLVEAHNASLTSVPPPAPPVAAPYSAPWEIRHNCGCPLIYDHNRTLIARFDDADTAYAVFDAHNRTSNVVPPAAPVPVPTQPAPKPWKADGYHVYTLDGVQIMRLVWESDVVKAVQAHNDSIGYTTPPPVKDWVDGVVDAYLHPTDRAADGDRLATIIRARAPKTP